MDSDPAGALGGVLAGVWSELARAVADRRHGFHVPSIATVALDGAPSVRSVVLRAVDADRGVLRCHTDRRSAKVAEIARDPRVAWHFYASDLNLQLRVRGDATILADGPVADRAWDASAVTSRRCYLAPRAPGDVAEGPSPNLPEAVRGRRPTEEETRPGRANFLVVETRVVAIDWLHLASDGHRRARFARAGDVPNSTGWSATWIEP